MNLRFSDGGHGTKIGKHKGYLVNLNILCQNRIYLAVALSSCLATVEVHQ